MASNSHTPTVNLGELLGACCDLATRAGTVIQTIYEKGDWQVIDKAFGDRELENKEEILGATDPTTIADKIAEKMISGSLQNTFQGLLVRGEENVEITEAHIVTPLLDLDIEIPEGIRELSLADVVVWVDPIDGTKEFTEGIKEAVTCLIGIAYRGRPVAGVINRPFTGQTIYGVVGVDGVFGYEADYLRRVNQQRDKTRRIIATTRSHFRRDMMEYISACQPTDFVRAGGCGGKVLMVLEGIADAYVFPSHGTKRWDTCAPEAILLAAGGRLTEPDGSLIDYSGDVDDPQNMNGFVATVFDESYHASFLRDNLEFRKYDVVFFGATGFTGNFGVEYLGEHYTGKENTDDLRFAIAGRSRGKLEAVLKKRVPDEEAARNLDILVCNSSDMESVDAMVRSTNVVVTTVGPYRKYGTNLVASCAKHGVDYVDLTGELDWVYEMREKYGTLARQTGSRIVTTCGYVAFPVDCALYDLTCYLENECGWTSDMGLDVTDITVLEGAGGMSGGTLASYLESVTAPNIRRMMADPTFFVERESRASCPLREVQPVGPKHLTMDSQSFWGIKSMYADTYRQIINRSNELNGMKYGNAGSRFTFQSYMKVPNVFLAFFVSFVQYLIPLLVMPLMKVSFVREFVRKRVPQPGTHGSSEEKLREAVWNLRLTARTPDGRIGAETALTLYGDAGYVNTSKMMLESGVALALQRKDILPAPPIARGGFLTPSAALGNQALRRLSRFRFWEYVVRRL